MATPTTGDLDRLDHHTLMGQAIALASSARQKGNKPFGALLANLAGDIILEAENTEFTENDFTRHAETNLLSEASRKFSTAELAQLVMYASTEPCAMCAGATFFTGVRAVVFGLSANSLASLWTSDNNPDPAVLDLTCRQVFDTSPGHPTTVIGPIMEKEAAVPHIGYVIPPK